MLAPVENALWSVLHTRSRQEKKMGRILAENNIPYFLPTIKVKTRHRGVKRFNDKLVFPSYVFAAISTINAADKEAVYSSKCVAKLINEPDDSALLHDLTQLKALLDAKSDQVLQQITRIKPGATVRVTQGPFKDIEGQVVRHQGKDLLVISVNMLGRSVAVELDETSVQAE
jgi:transcription antitermination factor NusG